MQLVHYHCRQCCRRRRPKNRSTSDSSTSTKHWRNIKTSYSKLFLLIWIKMSACVSVSKNRNVRTIPVDPLLFLVSLFILFSFISFFLLLSKSFQSRFLIYDNATWFRIKMKNMDWMKVCAQAWPMVSWWKVLNTNSMTYSWLWAIYYYMVRSLALHCEHCLAEMIFCAIRNIGHTKKKEYDVIYTSNSVSQFMD